MALENFQGINRFFSHLRTDEVVGVASPLVFREDLRLEASPLAVVSGGPRALAPGDLEVPRVRVDIRGVGVWGVSGVTDGDPDRRGLILGHKMSLCGRTTLFQNLPRDDAAFFYLSVCLFPE